MEDGRNVDEDWFIGKPVLRVWELNENSTRYDVITAGPSDEDLQKYWWSWAVVALIVGVASLIVFLGLATDRKARQNPFNVYLIYLCIPDFVFSLCCGITCLLNAVNGEYWAGWMCAFQQWYCVFGIGANAWLNACITWELYTMLKLGHRRRRYKSPTIKFVTIQALAVYIYMGFLCALVAIDAPNWPFHYGTASGLACLPIEVDRQSSFYFWLVFLPSFTGIPSISIIYVTYMVMSRKLLPPTGKRRLLTVYFGRLVLVFYVMWIPTLLILFAFSSFLPPWVHFLGGLWSHLQGAVSAVISLLKPDIARAVYRFVTCYSCQPSTRKRRKREASRRQSSASRRASSHRPSSRPVSSGHRASSSTPRRRSSLSDWLFARSGGNPSGGALEDTSQNSALDHQDLDPDVQESPQANGYVGEQGNWSSFHSTELWPSSNLPNSSYLPSMASSQGLGEPEPNTQIGDDCKGDQESDPLTDSTTAATAGSTHDPGLRQILEDSVEEDTETGEEVAEVNHATVQQENPRGTHPEDDISLPD